MRLMGQRLILAVPMPAGHSPADTTAQVQGSGRLMHHRPALRLVGAVIWLGVVIYLLWLGTRAVRAIEKVADKFQGRASAILLFGALLASPSGSLRASYGMAVPDSGCWVQGARTSLSSRASPLDSAVARLGGAEVKVCYGRPSARGRAIMGGLVPFGEPWRLGANEATTIHLPVAARLGDVALKPGVYSLYAIPGPSSWQIVVNESAERWGIPIDGGVRAHDVGAVTVASERTDAPVEALTLRLEPAGADAVALVVEWERTRVRATLKAGK